MILFMNAKNSAALEAQILDSLPTHSTTMEGSRENLNLPDARNIYEVVITVRQVEPEL